jgi:hypothetical protein
VPTASPRLFYSTPPPKRPDSAPAGLCAYRVTVHTTDTKNAQIEATVRLVLHGDTMSGREASLKARFDRGGTLTFTLHDSPMGRVEAIEIWHDAKGFNSKWHMSYVEVQELQPGGGRGPRSTFFHNDWIDSGAKNRVALGALGPSRNVYKITVFTSDVAVSRWERGHEKG